MSKALSVDLRERVLAAVANGAVHRDVTERFGVSAASVSRWRHRQKRQGHLRLARSAETGTRTGLKRMRSRYWPGWPKTAMPESATAQRRFARKPAW